MVHRVAVGDVVALIDDDGIPVLPRQVSVVAVRLQRVEADNRSLEERERVTAGGELASNALEPEAVQTDERQCETGPQLILRLFQHWRGVTIRMRSPRPLAQAR